MKKRLVLDALMTVLIVLALLSQLTGQFAHEVIGAVLIVACIVHLCTGSKTLKAIKLKSKDEAGFGHYKQLVVVFYVLVVALVFLALSAVIISRVLMVAGSYLSDLDSGNGYIWSKIHVVSACAFAICVVFHLALHWGVILGALGKRGPCGGQKTSRPAIVVATLIVICLAAFCVYTLVSYANSPGSSSYQPSNGTTRWLEDAYEQDGSDSSSTGESGPEGLGVYSAGDPRAKSDGSKASDLGSPDDEASSEESSEESSDSSSFIDAVSSATK